MNQRRHLAVVAGVSTLLASTAMSAVYQGSDYFLFVVDSPNWFLPIAAVIAAVVAGSVGARALHAPVWAQPFGGALALLLFVTVIFGAGFLGFIPTPGTFGTLGELISQAFREIAELSAPVPVHRGLLLLGVLGVGLVAIVVDFLAVSLRRASLAGLPLLALYAVPVSIDRDGMSWWTFALGAAGYLWLLVTDQIEHVQRWGRPFRAGNAADVFATTPLGTTGRWVGLFGIVIAAALPAVVPGLSLGNGPLGGIGDGFGGNGAGRSVQTIHPMTELKGRLTDRKEVEFLRLRTNDRQRFYLRLTTLDQFGPTGWTQRKLTALGDDRVSNGIRDDDDLGAGIPVRKQTSSVEITGMKSSPYLPLYARPTKVNVKGDWRWDDRADTVFSSRSTTNKLNYRFESSRVQYDPVKLAAATELDPSDAVVAEYTGTNGEAEPEAKGIADNLVKDKRTQYEKVMAINDFFAPSNGFRYTTETQPGTTGSDLADFLTNKRGYCEQYASAMAYLVRAVGIPARVAIGFGMGKQLNDYVSVSNKDAHAWVEVYFAGLGWVPFDPTPAGGAGRTGGLPWAQSANETENGNTPGGVATPTPSATPNAPAEEDLAPDTRDEFGEQGGTAAPKPVDVPLWLTVASGPLLSYLDGRVTNRVPVWAWWLLGVLAVLILCAVPGFWRRHVRRHRMAVVRAGHPLPAAHAAWDELIDTLADYGVPAEESETPRSTARRLAHSGLDDAELHAVELLAAEEERARYAPPATALASALAASTAGGSRADRGKVKAARQAHAIQRILAVQVVGRSVADRAGLRVRLRARLLPPSLVARTARSMTAWSEEISIGVRDIQSALRRKLIPQRFTTNP